MLERIEGYIIEKSFELTTETKYGGTVTNVKRKRVPGGGSSYSKTTRAKACGRTRGTANKLQSDEQSLRDGAYCFNTE